jgi:hypothetical protein
VPTTTGIKIRESLANAAPSTDVPTEVAAPVTLVHTAPSGRSEFTGRLTLFLVLSVSSVLP